jgi:hypothetical protein
MPPRDPAGGADRTSARPLKTFAWQGICLTVPENWELVFTQGSYQSGYVRLADEESVRMELHWQTATGPGTPAGAVDSHLSRLKKDARKKRLQFDVQRDLKLASPAGKDVECYRWTADHQALAMVSRCADCRRVVHVQLLGAPHESLKGLARTVFSSLSDDPQEGTLPWEFFDLRFRSPAGLPLSKSVLQTGCIRMSFSRRWTRLEFVRASLAQVLLAGKGLRTWFDGFYAAPLKRRAYRLKAAQMKGHEGVELEGRPWLPLNPLRLLGRARVTRAACWHCEETNRVLICGFDGPAAAGGIFEAAVQSFACCGKG